MDPGHRKHQHSSEATVPSLTGSQHGGELPNGRKRPGNPRPPGAAAESETFRWSCCVSARAGPRLTLIKAPAVRVGLTLQQSTGSIIFGAGLGGDCHRCDCLKAPIAGPLVGFSFPRFVGRHGQVDSQRYFSRLVQGVEQVRRSCQVVKKLL